MFDFQENKSFLKTCLYRLLVDVEGSIFAKLAHLDFINKKIIELIFKPNISFVATKESLLRTLLVLHLSMKLLQIWSGIIIEFVFDYLVHALSLYICYVHEDQSLCCSTDSISAAGLRTSKGMFLFLIN